MSMTGFAASPGIEVEPTCSSCSARQPRASRIRAARTRYCCGQSGSGSVTSMPMARGAAATQALAPAGGGESSNVTISARLGISAVYYPHITHERSLTPHRRGAQRSRSTRSAWLTWPSLRVSQLYLTAAHRVDWAATEGYGLVGGIGEYEGAWRMAYVRGPEGIIVSLAERIG